MESLADAERHYVGVTEDLKARLKQQNNGASVHTAKHAPWRLKTYVAFSDHQAALDFERYLKSASGRAFAKKRL